MPPDMTKDQLPAAWGGPVPLPEVGFYPNVDPGTYHRWPAYSSSRGSKLIISPAHMKAYVEEEQKETPALRIGRAIHVAVLEPDEFPVRYVRGPEGDGRTSAVKDATAWLRSERPDAEILRPFEWDQCEAIHDAVWAKQSASGLMDGPGDVELSLVWQDEETGVMCKGRLDRRSPDIRGTGEGAIVDLKTTRSASPREFERSIFTFGYHRQAALYLDGAHAHGSRMKHYVIVAVEKEPPYGVAVYRLTEGAIEAGRDENRQLLRLYGECERAGRWPDYPDEVRDVSLPDYAWKQVDERVAELEGAAA